MIKALLDTNIILDWMLDRQPFSKEANAIWDANKRGVFEAYVAAITPTNVYYIASKVKSASIVKQAIADLLATVQICPLNQAILQNAQTLQFSDYEDAVQHESAVASGLDVIVTRNLKDYSKATLPVYAPADFLTYLAGNP